MTRAQAKKLDEVHAWTDFLINKITVNGDDGSKPIIGVKNILEAHHKNDKVQNRQLAELAEITVGLKAKKKLRESFQTYLDSHGFVKFLLTPNRLKVGVGLAFLVLVSEALGIHGLSHVIRELLKFTGWIK